MLVKMWKDYSRRGRVSKVHFRFVGWWKVKGCHGRLKVTKKVMMLPVRSQEDTDWGATPLHKPVVSAVYPVPHVHFRVPVTHVDCETQLVEPEVQVCPALILHIDDSQTNVESAQLPSALQASPAAPVVVHKPDVCAV